MAATNVSKPPLGAFPENPAHPVLERPPRAQHEHRCGIVPADPSSNFVFVDDVVLTIVDVIVGALIERRKHAAFGPSQLVTVAVGRLAGRGTADRLVLVRIVLVRHTRAAVGRHKSVTEPPTSRRRASPARRYALV